MSGKVEIKPTIITDLAKNIQSSATNCETILSDIVAIMGRLAPNGGLWGGNDSNKLNGSFNNFKKSFNAFKDILEDRSKFLSGVAQQYLEADSTLEKKAPVVEVKTTEKATSTETTSATETTTEIKEKVEKPVEKVEKTTTNSSSKSYRMTCYYPQEGETSTGSGLTIRDFQVNNKGWYTYKGKIVIAAATEELLNSREYSYDTKMHTRVPGRHYYRYYDELTVNVDGVDYPAIILDSCGASMKLNEDRIDLFISNPKYMTDRLAVTVTNK